MPAKSTARKILDELSLAELKVFAHHYDLRTYGTKSKIAARICEHLKRNVDELVSAEGPWSSSDWNGFIEELGGSRRKSWTDIRTELVRCVQFDRDRLRRRMERIGNFGVSDIRRQPELVAQYADVLQVEPASLGRVLDELHGNTVIGSVWDDLIDKFGVHARDENDDYAASVARPEPQTSGLSSPQSRLLSRPVVLGSDRDPTLGRGVLLARRYRVRALLGTGGMARTFEVVDERAPGGARVCAAKFPNPECVDLLAREFAAGSEITHGHVCKYLHYDEDEVFGPFLLMEHGGDSLAARYAATPASWSEAREIVRQAALGLDAMHQRDWVHGDVSPSNILVDSRGNVRLADLGISARLTQSPSDVTRQATTITGQSDLFSAPEVRAGKLLRASDQWSLGRVLCAIIEGVDRWNQTQAFAENLSEDQREAVYRATHVDPRRRFASCAAFSDALGGISGGRSGNRG